MKHFADQIKHHSLSDPISFIFLSRLGGIAGLAAVIFAVVQMFWLADSFPVIEKILLPLPNLAAILWLIGVNERSCDERSNGLHIIYDGLPWVFKAGSGYPGKRQSLDKFALPGR